MPRFGKDKSGRNEELDRQAAEEVERLTRRGGPPGMGGGGGMGGMGGPPQIMSSPLDMIAAEMAEKPRPSQRRQQAPRKVAAKPQQAFTPMPSGEVGSSFGPGGLNPGPRGMGGAAAPPPSFGGGAHGEDYGGHVTGPPVYSAEPDEDEEISITELALMDHAAHTGHRPEDLVMQYDAGTAEEMRDAAMRAFYERQQARRPGATTNSPFAPAGMRGDPSGGGGRVANQDPAAAGGALAQRLANRRRREDEEARRAQPEAEPAAAPARARHDPTAPRAAAAASSAAKASAGKAVAAKAEAAVDEGALARVLARRRAALGVDAPAEPEPKPDSGATLAPGRRHASSRAAGSPGPRPVPVPSEVDDGGEVEAEQGPPSLDDMASAIPTRSAGPAKKAATARKTAKAPAAKRASKTPAPKAPATKAKAAPAAKAAKATSTKKGGATLAKAPAAKAQKAPAGRTAGKAKTVFCIECGEKNPAIAKFCFNCGNRLAVPEG
ncbi:MAG: zinc ribbon domain-containing protein [Acidimicrobiales bacterium]